MASVLDSTDLGDVIFSHGIVRVRLFNLCFDHSVIILNLNTSLRNNLSLLGFLLQLGTFFATLSSLGHQSGSALKD